MNLGDAARSVDCITLIGIPECESANTLTALIAIRIQIPIYLKVGVLTNSIFTSRTIGFDSQISALNLIADVLIGSTSPIGQAMNAVVNPDEGRTMSYLKVR